MNLDPQLSRFTVGATRWLTIHAAPAPLQRLLKAIDDSSEVLRVVPHRRTLRVLGQPTVIVKHFLPAGVWGLVKTIIRGDPAFREWTALRRAAHRRLPVPRVVAVGWRKKFLCRESFLVSEELSDAVPLGSYLYGIQRSAGFLRRQIVEQAARVLRRAHDAGMFHKDLHLDNLMVRNLQTHPEVFLIDLQRVDFRGPLKLGLRTRNLAELHGGNNAATRVERLRFLKTYLSGRPEISQELRPLLVQIEKKAMQHRRQVWRSRQKRCLADNREFVRLRFDGYVGAARRNWNGGSLPSSWSRPAEFLSSCVIIKDSRTTTVGAKAACNLEIHVKRYNYQGLGYAFKDVFRRSRAKRVWIAANSCLMRGVSVAPAAIYLERRRWRFLLDSYLVTETVKGERLPEIISECARRSFEKRALIRDLARYIAGMHRRQLANRDLKGANLIVSPRQSGGYSFAIVDFDGLRIGPVSRRMRIGNLGRLNREFLQANLVTRADRLRFLTTYLGSQEAGQWKDFWRRISRQTHVD